jgi:tRNA nucleotidyltransferase (CCA-adding enzyme)
LNRSLQDWIKRHERDVLPTEAERTKVDNVASKLINACERAIATSGRTASVVLGGSYAHDTWLPGEGDVDAYIVFPKEAGRSSLETVGLKVARLALKGYGIIVRYAEHPYLESYINGVRVNVVPCLSTQAGQWMSAADRSPYHTRYMRERLDDSKRFHIRLLKRFLKTQGLYGAEIKVRGFSGYVCEVLILKYGTLPDLLKGASSWNVGTSISVEPEVLGEQKKEFQILDPVDTSRNLARAISTRKLAEFVLLSGVVLSGTRCDPFERKLLRPSRLRRQFMENVVLISFRYSERAEDILWGELAKSAAGLARHLGVDGYRVLNHGIEADAGRCYIGFLLDRVEKSKFAVREGPYYYMRDGHSGFLESSRNLSWWFEEDGRIRRLEASQLGTVKEAIKYYMADPVARAGFARGLAEEAKRSWEMADGRRVAESDDMVARSVIRRLFGYARELDTC